MFHIAFLYGSCLTNPALYLQTSVSDAELSFRLYNHSFSFVLALRIQFMGSEVFSDEGCASVFSFPTYPESLNWEVVLQCN